MMHEMEPEGYSMNELQRALATSHCGQCDRWFNYNEQSLLQHMRDHPAHYNTQMAYEAAYLVAQQQIASSSAPDKLGVWGRDGAWYPHVQCQLPMQAKNLSCEPATSESDAGGSGSPSHSNNNIGGVQDVQKEEPVLKQGRQRAQVSAAPAVAAGTGPRRQRKPQGESQQSQNAIKTRPSPAQRVPRPEEFPPLAGAAVTPVRRWVPPPVSRKLRPEAGDFVPTSGAQVTSPQAPVHLNVEAPAWAPSTPGAAQE